MASAAPLPAQEPCRVAFPVAAGSEEEAYYRVAQTLGASGTQPWTLRAFGPGQLTDLLPRDTTLPWESSSVFTRAKCPEAGRPSVAFRLPRAHMIYNSAFPFGKNDGAVWAGRGLTLAAEGVASMRMGWLTATFAPVAFVAENAPFRLAPNGQTGKRVFADWRNPQEIDLPQRMGTGRYAQFDLGQSELRLDLAGAALGISTANQYWGPASDHPIILGNNAGGFPHAFVGTGRALRLWKLGRFHGRVFWGQTQETPYSPLSDTSVARLASGIIAVYQPSFLPGLEVGGGRFFHVLQDRFRIDGTELRRPFGALLKINRAQQLGTATGDEFAENQLASVFLRLVLPQDGVEFYGEYGREDHNWDLREFWLIPDHDAAYLIGARKAWRRGGDILNLRAEVLNSRVSHLAISSSQAPWYIHSTIRQGHTHRGQALGSAAGHGGGAAVLGVDRYTANGRFTLSWERLQLGDSRTLRAPDLLENDVAHVWTASRLRFGNRTDIEISASAIYEFNRHLVRDAFSVRTSLSLAPGVRWRHGR